MSNGQQRRWALIVHGGAKPIGDEERAENEEAWLDALAIERSGPVGWWRNSPDFAVACCAEDVEPSVWTNKQEEAPEHV